MQTSSIKRVIYGFNVIFVITGIIMVAVGASVKSHYYPYYTFLDDRYFSLPNMLIATGSLIFFISLLGFYGAMRESWCILMAFSILLTIIFIFELSVSIAGYVLSDKTATFIENTLRERLPDYGKSDEISSMWDLIHEEFQCCGVTGPTDWKAIYNNNSLPISCCPMLNGVVGAFYCNSDKPATVQEVATLDGEADPEPTDAPTTTVEPEPSPNDKSTTDPYASGCHSLFADFLKKHAVNIGAVGISLAVIQLVGIFVSFHLARQLKNSYYST